MTCGFAASGHPKIARHVPQNADTGHPKGEVALGQPLANESRARFQASSDGYDERDFAIAELCEVVALLSDFIHPGTSHGEPGDEAALDRALEVLARYRPAA